MQKLLISVRGPREAREAVRGGAGIINVEYPASELGTPYPLNIYSVRGTLERQGYDKVQVATSIGKKLCDRTLSCQAALGVAVAGARIVKFGLAELSLEAAAYVSETLVRTVRKFFPDRKLIPTVFVDDYLQRFFKPFRESAALVRLCKADGIHIDTYNKEIGRGLLDYCSTDDISGLVEQFRAMDKEVWIAGSIMRAEMPRLWPTGADVIAVRRAACEQLGNGRFGPIQADLVADLAATIPEGAQKEEIVLPIS